MNLQRKTNPGFSGAQLIGLRLFGLPPLFDEENGEGAPAGSAGGGEGGGEGGGTATQDPPNGQQQNANGGGNVPAGMTQTQLQALGGIVAGQVQQSVNNRLDQMEQRQNQFNETLEELRKPQNQNGFGGFFVRQGEDPLSSRGYEFWRLMSMKQGIIAEDQCKVEMDIHNSLHEAYVKHGFEKHDAKSILIPISSQALGNVDLGLKMEIRQRMIQGVAGFDPDHAAWTLQRSGGMTRQQALSTVDDTGLGVFLGPTQMGEMIDLLRAKEVFSRAGATQITLPPNGRIKFSKQTGSVTAGWIGETAGNETTPAMSHSEPSTGSLNMQAKKLYVLTKLPNELLRFGNSSVEAFLRNDMAISAALKLDSTSLEGISTGDAPTGLINYSGVLTRNAGTLATDGNTLEPEDLQLLISDLEQQNHDPEADGLTFVMRPELHAQIMNRRASVYDGSSTSEVGQFLFRVNRDDISRGMPTMINGYPSLKSTQISKTRTKGSGTDLTYLLAGIFRHWIIARSGVAEFATTDSGDTAFTTDQTWMRMIQHVDVGPRYENAFVYIDDLLREI